MGLQRVTITAWPSSLVPPQESEDVHSWAAPPRETEGKKVRVCVPSFLTVCTHLILGASVKSSHFQLQCAAVHVIPAVFNPG